LLAVLASDYMMIDCDERGAARRAAALAWIFHAP